MWRESVWGEGEEVMQPGISIVDPKIALLKKPQNPVCCFSTSQIKTTLNLPSLAKTNLAKCFKPYYPTVCE